MTAVIELQNVSKSISGKHILESISFRVELGELTTLIGPNGAGKSTIAALILGLDKQFRGKINVTSKLKIGYVPQKLNITKNLPMTADCFMKLMTNDYKTSSENEERLLQFAEFDQIKELDISKLSSGQMQKLLLSSVFMTEPSLLVLDEPTQSLDIQSQEAFYTLILDIIKKKTSTIFMISHDLHTVIRNSDKVICLNKHICCSGRPNHKEYNNAEFVNALSELGLYIHHHDHRH